MILAIISEKEISKEISELLFTATKEKYVKYNFRDAKDATSDVLKNLRISSSSKYGPFKKIVSVIEKSEKIVLVNDCNSDDKARVLRDMNAKFVHINCFNLFSEGDLYIEKKPKSIKDITDFISAVDMFIKMPVRDIASKEKMLDTHYMYVAE